MYLSIDNADFVLYSQIKRHVGSTILKSVCNIQSFLVARRCRWVERNYSIALHVCVCFYVTQHVYQFCRNGRQFYGIGLQVGNKNKKSQNNVYMHLTVLALARQMLHIIILYVLENIELKWPL